MGTFGKALGAFGAYIAGSSDLIRYLLNTSRSYLFSTSLPPAVCAAANEALELVTRESWRRTAVWRNRSLLVEGLRTLGIAPQGSETPILPIVIGDAGMAVRTANRLCDLGILALAIRPPTVPAGSSRIRMTVMATHAEQDIGRLISALSAIQKEGHLPHDIQG